MDTYPGAVGGFRIMKLKPNGAGPPMMLSIGRQLNRADFEWQAKKRNRMVCGKGSLHPGQRAPVWGCTCVIPETNVRPIGDLKAASKVLYSGPLVVVKTAAGEKLTITPDHPILTARGWIVAKTLRKRDQVVRYPDAGRKFAGTHVDYLPSQIDDLHAALSERRSSSKLRNRVHSLDFHGDGRFMEGDIDVVRADSLLSSQDYALNAEHIPQHQLFGVAASPFEGLRPRATRGMIRTTLAGVLGGRANLDPETVSYPISESRVRNTSLFSETADGLTGQVALHESVQALDDSKPPPRLATRNAGADEMLADDAVADAITLTDLRERLAAPVTLDHVVKVEVIRQWSGHVYDLQTSSGLYAAGNIIIHNCGFWFYKKMEDLRKRVPPATYGITEGAYVLLAGWGKVVEHEEGVRTEFARPLVILDEQPANGPEGVGMSYEKWRRWVGLIGLPMIAPEEIDIAAQMYGLEMLEYAKPPRIVQVLFPDGRIIFVDPDASPVVAVSEGVTLPEPTPQLSPLDVHRFGWELEKRYYVDDMGRSQTWWGVRNAPESVMLHNQAQIERALRSPGTALGHPRG